MEYTKSSLKNIKSNAKALGVEVKESTRKNKKFDIYKDGDYLLSIGDSRYKDYHLYKQTGNKEKAEERRQLYKARHAKNKDEKGTAGYYAWHILWN